MTQPSHWRSLWYGTRWNLPIGTGAAATIPRIISDDEGPAAAAASSIIASTTTGKRWWQHCDTPSTYLDRLVKCGMQCRTIDTKCCLHAFNKGLSLGSLCLHSLRLPFLFLQSKQFTAHIVDWANLWGLSLISYSQINLLHILTFMLQTCRGKAPYLYPTFAIHLSLTKPEAPLKYLAKLNLQLLHVL